MLNYDQEAVEAIGRRVKLYREIAGLTLKEVGDKLNRNKSNISRTETGKVKRLATSVVTLRDICYVYEVDKEVFFKRVGYFDSQLNSDNYLNTYLKGLRFRRNLRQKFAAQYLSFDRMQLAYFEQPGGVRLQHSVRLIKQWAIAVNQQPERFFVELCKESETTP